MTIPLLWKGTAVVCGCWMLLACALAGLGALAVRVVRPKLESRPGPWNLVWFGFVALVALLQVLHFGVAIDWKVTAALTGIGLAGFCFLVLPRWPGRVFSPGGVAFFLILAPLALWVANRSLGLPGNFDSGLYHFNAVRWINEYPAVLGLGNLHGRLAFNQSYFLYVAFLNVSPFFGKGYQVANSFLLVLFLAGLVGRFVSLNGEAKKPTPADMFALLWIPVALWQIGSPNLTSPSPDMAVFIIGAVLSILFAQQLLPGGEKDSDRKGEVLLILALGLVGITIKLSFAVFALSLFMLTVLFGSRGEGGAGKLTNLRVLSGWVALTVTAIMLPWFARGIVTSGYVAYPSTFLAFPVDWRVPEPLAEEEREWVRSWARSPGNPDRESVLADSRWFRPWLGRMAEYGPIRLPVLLCAVAILVYGAMHSFASGRTGKGWRLWLPFLPALCWLTFWFLVAPDPRFAGSAFWITGLWSTVLPLSLLTETWRPLAFILSVGVAALSMLLFITDPSPFLREVGPEAFKLLGEAPMKEKTTRSGLVVLVPLKAGQSWDSRLPSTPNFRPGLVLRNPEGGLRHGFRLEDE